MIHKKLKLIGTTVLGNIVEYYDFGVYAVFAPVIGDTFFPENSNETLLAFVVFAIGFIMRPVGGVILGYIGDVFGRKIALRISISGMAISTVIIGLLPSYDTIGITAPILLILMRLFQGICIGGEGAGSAIFILEHMYDSKHVGLVGSTVMAANVFGTLLANVVGIIIGATCGINNFSWRYGFLFGAALGFIGAYFRSKNEETPVFAELKIKHGKNRVDKPNPLAQIAKSKKYSVILVIAIAAAATSFSYTIRGYFITFFHLILNYSYNEALCITIFSLIVLVLCLPFFGHISCKVGYAKFLVFSAIISAICIIPVFYILSLENQSTWIMLIGVFFMSMLCATISAPAYTYALRLFPIHLRYSGVSLGWNIGNAIFGGTTPMIATMLVGHFGRIAPAYYILSTSCLFVATNVILMILVHLKTIKQKRLRLDIARLDIATKTTN